MRYSNRAFTLIELLIVVLIISILSAIAVPAFLNAQVRAKIAQVQSNLKAIDISIQQFQLDKGMMLVDLKDDDHQWGIDRILNDFHGVGNETFRTNKSVFMPLTTPVSFLSSIPENPFTNEMNQLIMMDNREPYTSINSYHYADYDPLETVYPFKYVDTADVYPLSRHARSRKYIQLNKNEYQLWGSGPWQSRHVIFTTENYPYNPSNGLFSGGVIILISGVGVLQ